MSYPPREVTATFFVQLQAKRSWNGKDVIGVKAARITQDRPETVVPDAKVVKMKVTLPAEAFEQLPVVSIVVPLEEATQIAGEAVTA